MALSRGEGLMKVCVSLPLFPIRHIPSFQTCLSVVYFLYLTLLVFFSILLRVSIPLVLYDKVVVVFYFDWVTRNSVYASFAQVLQGRKKMEKNPDIQDQKNTASVVSLCEMQFRPKYVQLKKNVSLYSSPYLMTQAVWMIVSLMTNTMLNWRNRGWRQVYMCMLI